MINKDIDLSFLSTININSKGARKAIRTGWFHKLGVWWVKYARRVVYPVSSPGTACIETLKVILPASYFSLCFQLSCYDSPVLLFILYEDFCLHSDIIKMAYTKNSRMQSQSTMWFTWCIMPRFEYHSQTRPVGPCLLANIQYYRIGSGRCLNLETVVAL